MKLLQDYLEEFDEYFVEMHPMFGHDMHNKPILYDMEKDKVNELKQFLSDTIKEVTGDMVGEEEKNVYYPEERGWNDCVCEQSAKRDKILGGGKK